jgi:hypothetical protein
MALSSASEAASCLVVIKKKKDGAVPEVDFAFCKLAKDFPSRHRDPKLEIACTKRL